MSEIDPSKPVVGIYNNMVGRVVCHDLKGEVPLLVAWTKKDGTEYVNSYTLDGRVNRYEIQPIIKNQEVEEWRVIFKASPDQKEITGFDHFVGTMSFSSKEAANALRNITNNFIAVVRVK